MIDDLIDLMAARMLLIGFSYLGLVLIRSEQFFGKMRYCKMKKIRDKLLGLWCAQVVDSACCIVRMSKKVFNCFLVLG